MADDEVRFLVRDWTRASLPRDPEVDPPCHFDAQGKALYRVLAFRAPFSIYSGMLAMGSSATSDLLTGNHAGDLNGALGRARLTHHLVSLAVTIHANDPGTVYAVIRSEGEMDDLYDFSYAAPPPAPHAAALQLAQRPAVEERLPRIYRDTFQFRKDWELSIATLEEWSR